MKFRTQDLKSIPIEQVATSLGLHTRQSGAGSVTRCTHPGHEVRHPSMSLDSRRNRFKCFACGNTGTPIDLAMQVLDTDFLGAASWIGQTFALVPALSKHSWPRRESHLRQRSSSGPRQHTVTSPRKDSPAPAPEVLEALIESLEPASSVAQEYLSSRGLSAATAAQHRVVFLTDTRGADEVLRRRFPSERLLASGLYKNTEGRGRPVFRFFRHRLLFPLLVDGRPVFLQGRSLDPSVTPKYLSTGGTIPAPYNVDVLKTLSPGSRVLIAEGPIDTLTLVQHGYPAVGLFGVGSFKPEWTRLFRGLSVVLAFDPDEAGAGGVERVGALFASAGQRVKAITLPKDNDINDFFRRGIL